MNAYTTHYERFKGRSEKGGGSRPNPKAVQKSSGVEKSEKSKEAVLSSKSAVDIPVPPPPTDKASNEDFIDLRDDEEE
jgi:hypothetical protein